MLDVSLHSTRPFFVSGAGNMHLKGRIQRYFLISLLYFLEDSSSFLVFLFPYLLHFLFLNKKMILKGKLYGRKS